MHRSISILDSNSCMDDDRSLPTNIFIFLFFCPLIVCGCECVHLSLFPSVRLYIQLFVGGVWGPRNIFSIDLKTSCVESYYVAFLRRPARKARTYLRVHVCIVECRQRIWNRTNAPLHVGRPSLWSKSLNPTHIIGHIGIAKRNSKL